MKAVCPCSQCHGDFDSRAVTTVPRYLQAKDALASAQVCPACLAPVLAEAERYLEGARAEAPYMPGYGLRYNEVIEQFVGFFLCSGLFRTAIEVRYAPSIDAGIARVRRALREIRTGRRRVTPGGVA